MSQRAETGMNRTEAIERLKSSRAEWEALIELVPENRRRVRAWAGGWNLGDLIAHVDFYEWWTGEFFIKRDWPFIDQSLNTADVDERNHALYNLNRERSFEDVMSESPTMHGHLVHALEAMTDEEYDNPALLGQASDGSWAVEVLLAGGSWRHYEQHRPDVEAILRFAD
jgi:hypothetical protein